MTATFDLFTKRTRLLYIGTTLSFITILTISILGILNVQYKTVFEPLFDALILISTLSTLAFIFLAGYGVIKTYVKDGELILADDYLIIDKTKILLTEAQNLSFKIGYRNIKRPGKIVGNYISVVDKNENLYNRRFVIRSRDNTADFDTITLQWVKDGVDFGLLYHNIW